MVYMVSSKTFLLLLAKQNYPNKRQNSASSYCLLVLCTLTCNIDPYIQMLHWSISKPGKVIPQQLSQLLFSLKFIQSHKMSCTKVG